MQSALPTPVAFRATEVQLAQFVRGLTAVLNQWTALLLVTQHCDASAMPSIRDALIEWHTRDGEVYADEMEDFFFDFFDNVRSVSIEDDSMSEVGSALHDMYRRCCQDDFSAVEKYVQSEALFRQMNPLAQCVNAGGVAECDASDDEETCSGASPSSPGHGEGTQTYPSPDDEESACTLPPSQGTPQQGNRSQGNGKAKPGNVNKKKNVFSKSSGGWSTVL